MGRIASFLDTQQIGEIRIGQTRHDLVAIFGQPDKWVGQPPNIGWQIIDPYEADIWLYYDKSVGALFDGDGIVQAILIYAQSVNKNTYPFTEWPDIGAWVISDLIKYANLNNIMHKIVYINPELPRLVIGDCCIVMEDIILSRCARDYGDGRIAWLSLYSNKFNLDFIKAISP